MEKKKWKSYKWRDCKILTDPVHMIDWNQLLAILYLSGGTSFEKLLVMYKHLRRRYRG